MQNTDTRYTVGEAKNSCPLALSKNEKEETGGRSLGNESDTEKEGDLGDEQERAKCVSIDNTCLTGSMVGLQRCDTH